MKDPKYIKQLELAIINGKKVLLQDVGDELDPVLDNVLNKSIVTSKDGRTSLIKVD
jgi:hypothetical protein